MTTIARTSASLLRCGVIVIPSRPVSKYGSRVWSSDGELGHCTSGVGIEAQSIGDDGMVDVGVGAEEWWSM